jgi:hypothetical protein
MGWNCLTGSLNGIFTGSAAYPFLAHNMGWDYDVGKVTIPYFVTSGTGETDDVEKVRARATGAEHEACFLYLDNIGSGIRVETGNKQRFLRMLGLCAPRKDIPFGVFFCLKALIRFDSF